MSRCFPFPPPGYEKKSSIEAKDLLLKEKHKEKKHKRDKKDKEKREGKEKKDKDRSKDKHRDKKDRKDKHNDKDRDRDKEKSQTSEEKRVEPQPGFSVGEKFGSNSLQNSEIKDSKYVQELAKRIRDEGKVSGSQMVQKIASADQRTKPQGMAIESSIGRQLDGKKKMNDKNEDHRKVNGVQNIIDGRGSEKAVGENFPSMVRERVERVSKPLEKKDAEKQMEGKESKDKDGKHKDRDREKSRKSKDKDRDKKKKKEEKANEMIQPCKEQPKLKESSPNLKDSSPKLKESSPNLKDSSPKLKESSPKLKGSSKDSLDFRNAKSSDPMKSSSISSVDEENTGKRKQLEMNGYLLDNGIRPSKFPRPLSHPGIENGRKLESSQTAFQFTMEKQKPGNTNRVDLKEPKLNGQMTAQQLKVGSTKPPSANVAFKDNGEASERPPHPDLKYLDQILSIPKVEELPDTIDNEWLLSCSHRQSKNPGANSPGVDGTRQVWAEALHLESADISALPYVIPY